MIHPIATVVITLVSLGLAGSAAAYPGGTPIQQTDVAPFCAGCHAARSTDNLANLPPARAQKELPAQKHLALIEAGEKGYAALSAEDRATLVTQLRALDEASTVVLTAPDKVKAGETFEVSVALTGGAGPVVGVALVDSDQRYHARPAPSSGWLVVGAPLIEVGGETRSDWLEKRPESAGRNLAFVNVTGIESDAAEGRFAAATVRWTLRAPATTGTVPLAAVYLYGTEKGTPLGYTTDPVRGVQIRGGFTGASGRILFSDVHPIAVE